MSGIANAPVARAPLVGRSDLPPRPQENRGVLPDLVHTGLVRSITRHARTVRKPALVLQELGEAAARAEGHSGEPGPAYLDFPTDTLRAEVPGPLQSGEHFAARPRPLLVPDEASVAGVVELLWSAERPLLISGRGASSEPIAPLDAPGVPYLDTGESKGLVPESHPSVVAAMRAAVMGEADLVVTIGRRLDFQLGCGSPAVFGDGVFGCNAMEIDTAARHRGPLLIVVANNGARQIEVHDRSTTHRKVTGPGCLTCNRWPPGTWPNSAGVLAGPVDAAHGRATRGLRYPCPSAATPSSPGSFRHRRAALLARTQPRPRR